MFPVPKMFHLYEMKTGYLMICLHTDYNMLQLQYNRLILQMYDQYLLVHSVHSSQDMGYYPIYIYI